MECKYFVIKQLMDKVVEFLLIYIGLQQTVRFSDPEKFNLQILSVLCIYNVQIEIKRNFVTLSNNLKC